MKKKLRDFIAKAEFQPVLTELAKKTDISELQKLWDKKTAKEAALVAAKQQYTSEDYEVATQEFNHVCYELIRLVDAHF